MDYSTKGRRVVAAVIEQQGRLLVCQRPAQKRHGVQWEFPGGQLEAGEDLFAAASRELHEELGLVLIALGDVLHRDRDPGSPYVVEFAPATVEGVPQLNEHQALRWERMEALLELDLAPVDRAFVEAVHDQRAGGNRLPPRE